MGSRRGPALRRRHDRVVEPQAVRQLVRARAGTLARHVDAHPGQRGHRHPRAGRVRDRVHRQPGAGPGTQPQRRRRGRTGPRRRTRGRRRHLVRQSLRRPHRRRRRLAERAPAATAPTTSRTLARAGWNWPGGCARPAGCRCAPATRISPRASSQWTGGTPAPAALPRGRPVDPPPHAPGVRRCLAGARPRRRVLPRQRPWRLARHRSVLRGLRRHPARARLRRRRCGRELAPVRLFDALPSSRASPTCSTAGTRTCWGIPRWAAPSSPGCALLQVADVVFGYDEDPGAAGRLARRAPRRAGGPARPQRLGQDHAAAADGGNAVPQSGARAARRPRPPQPAACRPRASHRGRAPGDATRLRVHRARTRAHGAVSASRPVRTRGPGRRGDRDGARWRPPAPRTSRGAGSRRSAVARSSASSSPARWRSSSRAGGGARDGGADAGGRGAVAAARRADRVAGPALPDRGGVAAAPPQHRTRADAGRVDARPELRRLAVPAPRAAARRAAWSPRAGRRTC